MQLEFDHFVEDVRQLVVLSGGHVKALGLAYQLDRVMDRFDRRNAGRVWLLTHPKVRWLFRREANPWNHF